MTNTNLREISFQFSDKVAAREFAYAMDEQVWVIDREDCLVTIEVDGRASEALAAASHYFTR